MPEVDVPGVGRVERKYVWGGLAVAASIAAWYWWRARMASSSSTSSTTDPNAIDPLTGLPFSAEQNGNTGFVNPNPVTSIDTRTGNGINDNQAWTADVIEKLGNVGQDPAFVSGVLGKYLAEQPLTSEEANLVRMAWAFSGKPPQGPNNFTLATGTSTPGGSGDTRKGPPYPFGGSPDNPNFAVTGMSKVDGWITALQSHGVHVVWSQVESLNPGIWSNIKNTGSGRHEDNYFVHPATYKLPSQAAWYK